jgi:hypothetical protein
MDPREKRELREHKRVLKQKGNQRLRRQVRRAIEESPDEAHRLEPDYGPFRTRELNGLDQDATRRRRAPENREPADDASSVED